ncbi:hypothetical protein pipiens_019871, partial [Culex pipiens pipiens]
MVEFCFFGNNSREDKFITVLTNKSKQIQNLLEQNDQILTSYH